MRRPLPGALPCRRLAARRTGWAQARGVHDPRRYAFDVNIETLDVLNHKRLLDSAREEPNSISFQVRPVDVVPSGNAAVRPGSASHMAEASDNVRGRALCACSSWHPGFEPRAVHRRAVQGGAHESGRPQHTPRPRLHPPQVAPPLSPRTHSPLMNFHRPLPRPAFGSSPNLQVRRVGAGPGPAA